MTTILDELCPMYVGAEALTLELADPLTSLRAFRSIDITVSYDGAGAEGVRLPLEQIVTGPSASSFRRHVFWRSAPSTITLTPQEGGAHTVLLREVGHNRLRGKLSLDVAGEQADPPTIRSSSS